MKSLNRTALDIFALNILLLGLVTMVVACGFGGGGGGGSDSDEVNVIPAQVGLNVSPRRLDTGDKTKITVFLTNLNEGGVQLKIRVPTNLDYVRSSSRIKINGEYESLDPNVVTSSTDKTYIVYFLSGNLLGDDNYGELELVLLGSGGVSSGTVELDADLDRPSLPTSERFAVASPQFEATESVGITVDGDSSGGGSSTGTATPTPTATATTQAP